MAFINQTHFMHNSHSKIQLTGTDWGFLRHSANKLMAQKIFCGRPVILVAFETDCNKLRGCFWHPPWHFADRRIFSGDLEDGGDTFELVPWWITSQHLDHGTAKTPTHNTHTLLVVTQTVQCQPPSSLCWQIQTHCASLRDMLHWLPVPQCHPGSRCG